MGKSSRLFSRHEDWTSYEKSHPRLPEKQSGDCKDSTKDVCISRRLIEPCFDTHAKHTHHGKLPVALYREERWPNSGAMVASIGGHNRVSGRLVVRATSVLYPALNVLAKVWAESVTLPPIPPKKDMRLISHHRKAPAYAHTAQHMMQCHLPDHTVRGYRIHSIRRGY